MQGGGEGVTADRCGDKIPKHVCKRGEYFVIEPTKQIGKQDGMPVKIWIVEKHKKSKKAKSPPAGKVIKFFVVAALAVGGGGSS